MAKNKERLDKILTDKGFFETKSKAQGAIMAGDVKINDEVITKAGYLLELKDNTRIEIKSLPFVSRGGLKLDKAVKAFDIDLKGRVCLDGYGQIAWKLRSDERVKVVERTNIKNCEPSEIYDETDILPDFCAMDLSFISVTKVLENIKKLMDKDTIEIVTLIKPQFEAGKELVGKNGVVREKSTHYKVIQDVINYAQTLDLYPEKLTFSPIKGPAGNIEYLVKLVNHKTDFESDLINKIVEEANENNF